MWFRSFRNSDCCFKYIKLILAELLMTKTQSNFTKLLMNNTEINC